MKNCIRKCMSLIGILLAGTVLLAGCGKKSEGDMLARIQKEGKIVIATEGTWSPWTFHDENDKLVGYDVEVAQKIAEKLGVKAEFVEGEWDSLLAGLEVGRYDIMANGVEVTEERQQKYDFSNPYGYIRTAIIVRSDDNRITKFEDLKGMKTANTISSVYATIAESYGANTVGVDDLNQTIENLIQNRIDATLNSEDTFYDYIKAHPDANIKIAALSAESSTVCIPMPKGENSKTLLEAINKAIEELSSDGTLAAISNKYFGKDITK